MQRAVNSTEVARRAGVSRTTVSFVLNGRDDSGRIPTATRDRVLQAAQELGYSPNHLARVLLSGRSYLINLLVRHVHPAFFSRAIESFHAALRGSGYDLRIQETADWTPERWNDLPRDRWPVDGTIVIEEEAAVARLATSEQHQKPLVSVGASFCTDVDHVGIDLYAGTSLAVRHLIESGRQKIAFLAPAYQNRTSRGEAYEDAMRHAGQDCRVIIAESDWSYPERERAREAVARFIAGEGASVDALLCFNDEFAIGALRALKDAGVRVPDGIVIAGCDDIDETRYHDPALTTLRYPYDEAARLAWEMLRKRIEEPDIDLQSIVLTPELVVRQSSSPAAPRP